jgi:RNA polymerase sigma-70 factor (ECF subfamily)
LEVTLDDAQDLISATPAPDRAYERKWAHAVLANTLERLRQDCVLTGKTARFEVLESLIFDTSKGEGATEDHAARLGLPLNATKVALTRMRQRYRELLRVEVARLVDDPAQIDDEIAHLQRALRG